MYADDLVIFSETVVGLQTQLNSLEIYCKEWSLKINVQKTKIVIFRNGGKLYDNEKFYIDDNTEIEVVNKFTYLGLCFNYNGKFTEAEKQLGMQGRKAVFALNKNINGLFLNNETLLSLFDTYICSILNYASAIWGSHKGQNVEKVQLDFCKKLLGVKRTTCNIMIYSELGLVPLNAVRKLYMLKYWGKLLVTNNCILKDCYLTLLEKHNDGKINWVSEIHKLLTELGFTEIWNKQYLDVSFIPLIKQRIFDQEKQIVLGKISDSSKCFLYRHLLYSYDMQLYLKRPIPKKLQNCISRFRLSSHSLSIETGRYHNIVQTNRLCPICHTDIEDEFHFILKCPMYDDLRKLFIKPFYYERPSVFKLIQLFTTVNLKEICNLGRFLLRATIKRNLLI